MVQTVTSSSDRVLPYTRGLSLFITPFLLVAFVVLYLFPGDTARLFAWTIAPTMTPMMLASAYLGGAYFFLRVLGERHWHAIRFGFPAVTLFAALLGIATVLHWDRFNHSHIAFWLWAGLYFTAPLLVLGAWLANRGTAPPPDPADQRIGRAARWVIVCGGLASLGQGLWMFLAPAQVIPLWPWALTPLTCRVLGAVFCLGAVGVGALTDVRWSTLRLMVQVEAVMLGLILVAAVRARTELDPGRPLTWVLLGGMVLALGGSLGLWVRQERPSRTGPAHLER